jgi:hypothetical protein
MEVTQLMLVLENSVISFEMEALSLAQSPVYGYIVFGHTPGFSNFTRIKWPMVATCFEPAGASTLYLH